MVYFARHCQADSCFKQAIGEDTKGKLMDEITTAGQSISMLLQFEELWKKISKYQRRHSRGQYLLFPILP